MNTPTPPNAPCVTPDAIQQLFVQDECLIEAITENQQLEKLDECLTYLKNLQQNLAFLASLADFQPPPMPYVSPNVMQSTDRRTTRSQTMKTGDAIIHTAPVEQIKFPPPQIPYPPPYLPMFPPNFIHLLPQVNIPPTVSNTNSSISMQRAPAKFWTAKEKELFLEGMQKFGTKDMKSIANFIGTRTPTQVRSHMQKYLAKLQTRNEKQSQSQPQS